jgi:hypothetical protein
MSQLQNFASCRTMGAAVDLRAIGYRQTRWLNAAQESPGGPFRDLGFSFWPVSVAPTSESETSGREIP